MLPTCSFYKVRVGSTVASVRASCFLAAGVEEQLVLALEGKDVLGVAYQVQSPACSKKVCAHQDVPVPLVSTCSVNWLAWVV